MAPRGVVYCAALANVLIAGLAPSQLLQKRSTITGRYEAPRVDLALVRTLPVRKQNSSTARPESQTLFR
ncbi:hypothetical protein L209DRAFT_757231 [Thermothelomyces heterothallicus CBS 203.75]